MRNVKQGSQILEQLYDQEFIQDSNVKNQGCIKRVRTAKKKKTILSTSESRELQTAPSEVMLGKMKKGISEIYQKKMEEHFQTETAAPQEQ